jgi:hypothetical protein
MQMNTATLILTPINAPDSLSYEVEQFAELLARIYVRCLQEQDPQVLARLAITNSTHEEVQNAAA